MRDLICAAALAGMFALMASGAEARALQPKPSPPEKSPAAAPAERYGVRTVYRSEAGKGYTARERRMADCLATYPNYDPAKDRVQVRPGVTRRCDL